MSTAFAHVKNKFNDSPEGADGALKCEFVTVTPRMAQAWLAQNSGNRRIRPGTQSKYARDMANGNWRVTGDPIRFNGDGSLADGQHRLGACVEANVSFTTLVIYGLSGDDKAVLDTGAKRSLGDALRWRGETNVAQLGAAITWCLRYEAQQFANPQFNISHVEAITWLSSNPSIRDSLNLARQVRERLLIPATICAGVHYETSRLSPEDATAFFEHLKDGSGLVEGSPILALRGWAERIAVRRDRPRSLVYSAVVIKAMNAWREGKAVQTIGWRAGGAQAESFPMLKDTTI